MSDHEPEPSGSSEPSGPSEPPAVPDRSDDDRDRGWGGEEETADRDDDDRFTRERPPHW